MPQTTNQPSTGSKKDFQGQRPPMGSTPDRDTKDERRDHQQADSNVSASETAWRASNSRDTKSGVDRERREPSRDEKRASGTFNDDDDKNRDAKTMGQA